MKQRKAVSVYKCSPTLEDDSRTIDNDPKKKRAIIINEIYNYHIALQVEISRAIGVDNPKTHPFILNRHYNVVYWVDPGKELRTKVTVGINGNPLWDQKGVFILDNLDDRPPYLNVEVQRFNSNNVDPGTSCGRVVVGKARIPFPEEFDRRKTGSFPLVRADGKDQKPEGRILVSVRMKRIRI